MWKGYQRTLLYSLLYRIQSLWNNKDSSCSSSTPIPNLCKTQIVFWLLNKNLKSQHVAMTLAIWFFENIHQKIERLAPNQRQSSQLLKGIFRRWVLPSHLQDFPRLTVNQETAAGSEAAVGLVRNVFCDGVFRAIAKSYSAKSLYHGWRRDGVIVDETVPWWVSCKR